MHEQSFEKVYCILPNISTGIPRYDEFELTDGVDLTFPYDGFYTYKIYEQSSPSNLDPDLTTSLCEEGRAHVWEAEEPFNEFSTTIVNNIYEANNTVSVYSQVVDFSSTPMNSIVYRCDGTFLAASYGQNETNLTDLIAMFNADPPVQIQATFLDYGICYDNGDGRVRMEMTQAAYDGLACSGTLTLDVIYD